MRGSAGEQAWFQLYVGASIDQAMGLIERAAGCGYHVLVLTVDVPQVARRIRDLHNGFRVPFRIGPRLALDFARHPRWSLSTLFHGAPSPKNFDAPGGANGFMRDAGRGAVDWAFLDRLRRCWRGALVVKGVLSTADAVRIRDVGADAIYVSNHGGRQLDSAPPAIQMLPHIRAAVGDAFPLIFDSGVRCGEDVVKALALGANFVMLGRPLLYAIGADGARGLATILDIVADDVSVTLAQIGRRRIADVDGSVLAELPGTRPVAPTFDRPVAVLETRRE
jgi:L-lactate dehydrogenase (cytochrome)